MRKILLAALLLASACSGGDGVGEGKSGCALAEKAFVAYDDSVDAATNNTATPQDQAKLMQTVAEKMESAATIAAPELKAHAQKAAVSAGRLRVALTGGDANVEAEVATLRTEMRAASDYCHAD